MSTQYAGQSANITPTPSTPIQASTNTAPIRITTTGPHNIADGTRVEVGFHQVNTTANGVWRVSRISATQIDLIGSVGNGVGGLTGSVQPFGLGNFTLIDDSPAPTATSLNTPPEFNADEGAFIAEAVGGYKLINESPPALPDFSITTDDLTNWETFTVVAQNVWTPPDGGTIFTYPGPVQIGDVIDVELETTITLGTAHGGSSFLLQSLFVSDSQPGVADGFTRFPGTSRGFQLLFVAGGATSTPLILRGRYTIPVLHGGGAFKIQPRALSMTNAPFPVTWDLGGDRRVSFKHYRATLMPQ